MQTNQLTKCPTLPSPLQVLPDMKSRWRDVDLDFDQAANQIVSDHGRDGEFRDLPVVDLRMYAVGADHGHFAIMPLGKHAEPRRLRSAALSMLCTRLGVPVEFLRDRLPAPLQLAILNLLLAEGDKSTGATLRLRGSDVSAIVSSRYAPLDAEDLMQTLRDVFVAEGILTDVRVKAIASGMTDVMRVILPSTQVALKVGDVSAMGLDISSSSFGRSAVNVRAMTWRLVCTNGLRSAESAGGASFRHLGDPARLRDGLREAVPTVLARGAGLLDQWRRATTSYVQDVANAIDALRELTTNERQRVHDAVVAEADVGALPERLDAYRFVNGLTKAAHDAEPARRLELEAMAGEWLARGVR